MSADPWEIFAEVFPDPPQPERPPPPAFQTPTTGSAYVQSALDKETGKVAAAGRGTRSDVLNTAAFSLGQLVAGGVLDEQVVRDALYQASVQNQHVADDGPGEIIGSINSGLTAGMQQPRGVPERPDVDGWLNTLPPNIDPETGEVLPPPADERTSWWPRDLGPLIAGTVPDEPPPAYLARQDGHRLFYAGKVNGLIGESESGKTWVALLAVAQSLAEGQRVTYLDFEDTAAGVLGRLRLLGATDQHLSRLAYIGPDDAFDAKAKGDLAEHITAHRPVLVILDGYNAAMTMLGLNLLDNMDIYRFALTLLRPIKATGAAVVTIDHVTKSKEGRGAFAIGGQAKRSDVDGCALSVEVVQPFGKGMSGKLRLTVSKDRPGLVRAVSQAAKHAGTVHLDSTDSAVHMRIEAPDLRPAEERGPFRPTVLMERVSHFMASLDGDAGVSQSAIEQAVTGNAKALRQAIAQLVDEGYITREGTAGALVHHHVKTYSESTDSMLNLTPSPRPDPVLARPETGSATPSSRPPLYRGTGTGSDRALQDSENDPESWWQK